MKTQQLFFVLFVGLIFSAMAVGCAQNGEAPVVASVATAVPPTAIPTAIPTLAPTATQTPTPLPTAVPTALPTATATMMPPEFANLVLALDYDEEAAVLRSQQDYFPVGVSYIAALFDYHVPASTHVQWSIYGDRKASEASGQLYLGAEHEQRGFIMRPPQGLDEGSYELVLELEGEVVLTRPFDVYWTPTLWPITIGQQAIGRGEVSGIAEQFLVGPDFLFASYPTINFRVGDLIVAEWFLDGEKLGEHRYLWDNPDWSTGTHANKIENQLEVGSPLPLGHYHIIVSVNDAPKQCQAFAIVETLDSPAPPTADGCATFTAEVTPPITNNSASNDPWSRYTVRTFAELTQLVNEQFSSVKEADTIYLEMSPDYQSPSRVRVVFTGDYRNTSDFRLIGITAWMATFAPTLTAEDVALLFGQEMRVLEGDQEYWLPAQNSLIPIMDEELSVGDEFDVLVVWMGTTRVDSQLEPIYLLNAFE